MSFWKKEKHPTRGAVIHYCERHDFRTEDPMEIEEHERIHEVESAGSH